MDKFELYDESIHYDEIRSWFIERELRPFSKDMISKSGLINEHICGFLYTTNSSMAWIDCIISNPKSTHIQRKESLEGLIPRLSAMAKIDGVKVIIAAA